MLPCPSSSSVVFQMMFWFAATLQLVGDPGAFHRYVPSGPPACGQLALIPPSSPAGGVGIAPSTGSGGELSSTGDGAVASSPVPASSPAPPLPELPAPSPEPLPVEEPPAAPLVLPPTEPLELEGGTWFELVGWLLHAIPRNNVPSTLATTTTQRLVER